MIFSLKHFYKLIFVMVIFCSHFKGYSSPPATIPLPQQEIQNKAPSKDLSKAIKNAIKKKDINEIKRLINSGVNVNEVVNQSGTTLLIQIILTGDVPLLENFLKEYHTKVNFNARDVYGVSSLRCASYHGTFDMIKILFKYGKRKILEDKDWASVPLLKAIDDGNEEIVNFFLQEGADPKSVKGDFIEGQYPLLSHICSQSLNNYHLMAHYLKILQAFLKAGVDPNSADTFGETPLHSAVRTNNVEFAKALLNAKANPDQRDRAGLSPRDLALQEGTKDMMKLFKPLEGVDINERFKYAVSIGNVSKIETIVKEAVKNGNTKIFNLKDNVGNTILSQVVSSAKPEAVKIFLDLAKANSVPLEINAQNSSTGDTALHKAVLTGNPEIVKLLLEYKADVNLADKQKCTPLFLTVIYLYFGNINITQATKIIHILLEAGARTKIKDFFNRTPLEIAEGYKEAKPSAEADALITLLKKQTL